MTYVIVGLGNPGPEYESTRHNAGRMAVVSIAKANDFDEWEDNKKANAFVASGKIGKGKATLLLPNTFMNSSGKSVGYFVKSKKAAEDLIVVHDDLDLPIGSLKIVFNRGSGGHRGVESIVRTIKTEGFVRIRVGISLATPSGKLKKPSGGKEVEKHILGKFSSKETDALKKVFKKVAEATEIVVRDGHEQAMNKFN